jgi:hypothetical protein
VVGRHERLADRQPVGGSEPLEFDPVNFGAAASVLAIAIDPNRPRPGWQGKA